MSFVRIKQIKGHPYAYLVENFWTGESSRQKVSQYLGKVMEFPCVSSAPAPNMNGSYTECLDELIIWQFTRMGFTRKGNVLSKGKTSFDVSRRGFFRKDKQVNVVIKNGEGFICAPTIKELYEFQAHGEDSQIGLALAKAIVNSGIEVPKELFVALFEKAVTLKRKSRKLAEEITSQASV